MNKAEVLALMDLILAILNSTESISEARTEILRLKIKLQSGVWDEVLSKLNV